MKKQVIFLLIWDVAFILLLYFYSFIGQWIKVYIGRAMGMPWLIYLQPMMPALIGCLIALLAFVNIKYITTLKLAILEFIMIGIPSLYFALTPLIYFFIVPSILNDFNIPVPIWIIRGDLYSIGAIVLGYEIVIFIARIVKFKRDKNV